MAVSMKPVLFGYQRARAGIESVDVINGRRVLAAFAEREGFTLGEINEETDPGRPSSALSALVAALPRLGVGAVAVPTLWDLGRTSWTVVAARHILERAGARLLVVETGWRGPS